MAKAQNEVTQCQSCVRTAINCAIEKDCFYESLQFEMYFPDKGYRQKTSGKSIFNFFLNNFDNSKLVSELTKPIEKINEDELNKPKVQFWKSFPDPHNDGASWGSFENEDSPNDDHDDDGRSYWIWELFFIIFLIEVIFFTFLILKYNM